MLEWLKRQILNKYLGSIIRTAFAAASGWLLSLGLPAETVTRFEEAGIPVAIAVATYVVIQLWSFMDKKKRD